MNTFVNSALYNFDNLISLWEDLPDYVYTCAYKEAFYKFILSREQSNIEIKNLVLHVLHHETGKSRPYFEFDRTQELDDEEVTLCKFYYKMLQPLTLSGNIHKLTHTPQYLRDYIIFVKDFSPKKLGLFTVEYIMRKIILNR